MHACKEDRKWKKVKVKSLSRVRLCDPMDCSLPGFSVTGFSRQEYWSGVPLPSPRESSWPRSQTQVSRIGGRCFNLWATREDLGRQKVMNLSGLAQFSHSVVSNSLWLHGLQQASLPCPSPTPRACSNSCPLSQWCYPIISSSVASFSSGPQTFPVSGSFPVSRLFTSGGQSIEASVSASVFPWISRVDFL